MDRGRVGEDRGSEETDGCPLTFSPRCQYEVSSTILFACCYSVYMGPNLVCSPSGYLSSHQHLLLDLSLFSYL
jgi:hypothetical protein